MPYVYRYTDKKDIKVKYIGIIKKESNFPNRFKQHLVDSWYDKGLWRIDYVKVATITDAEALEGHFIWFYRTDKYYNTAKTSWGKCSFAPNPNELDWIKYEDRSIFPQKKKHKKQRMKRKYEFTRRLLYGTNKAELSRLTGMTRSTIYNRIEHPEQTTAQELARIVKAKGLTTEEVMMVLKDLA